jgi:hypothetical protein
LKWVAEQLAVNTRHLGFVLARRSDRVELIKGASLGRQAVYQVVRRWREAGWVEYRTPFLGEPAYIWLTSKGLSDLGIEFRATQPSLAILKHVDAVNQVRLWLESDSRKNKPELWIPERILRRGERKLLHTPDAEAQIGGVKIAIEVELARKTQKRLQDILKSLEEDYETGWWFVSDDAEKGLKEAINGRERHFRIKPLREVSLSD